MTPSERRARGRSLSSRVPLLVATGFHLGRVPYAPGTVGSLAAFLLFLPFRHLQWTVHLSIVAILFAVGTYAAGTAERALGARDPSAVIIDEIVGCWAALLAIPPHHAPLLSALALFRLFDIWKPFPIDRVQSVPGGWGIMLDDLVAGFYANLCVRLFGWWLPGLTN
ncbi:MAG: phosphatidylglycerophosphatase A [Candidatus Methylomirabilis oxyfera]|nr:phosphatidylglycerophosphatase A [Candidatus Methylomirabilis oxyfera]